MSAADLSKVIKKAAKLNQFQLRMVTQTQGTDVKLTIRQSGAIENIDIQSIQYFKSMDKHVYAVFEERGEVLIDCTLKQLEQKFVNSFIRVHRNALVAIQYMAKLERDEQGVTCLYMNNLSAPIPVSRRHLSGVKKCFQ